MYTVSLIPHDDLVHVHVSKWPREGRYPQVLTSFDVAYEDGESALGMLKRCLVIAEQKLEELRQSPW